MKILEKWVFENCNLAYLLQRWRYSIRIVTNRTTYTSGKTAKNRDTLIEQSLCCELL